MSAMKVFNILGYIITLLCLLSMSLNTPLLWGTNEVLGMKGFVKHHWISKEKSKAVVEGKKKQNGDMVAVGGKRVKRKGRVGSKKEKAPPKMKAC